MYDAWAYSMVTGTIISLTDEEIAARLAPQYEDTTIYFKADLTTRDSRYNKIQALVDRGILGEELCPEEDYWHWPVRNKELLPVEFLPDLETFGEIRYY
jgi:hypothetical protein